MPEKQKKKNRWNRVKIIARRHRWITIAVAVFAVFYAQYAVLSSWYINKHKDEPLQIGTTFIPEYVELFGMNPQKTLDALTGDMGFKRFRFVSYWRTIEKQQGTYDFSQLDWQLKKAEESDAKVTLAIGLRQPRWPECHAPDWADGMSRDQWYPKLKDFMRATIEHVKDNPVVTSYQLENEYFLNVFGRCQDYGFDRERLVDEYRFVKSLDSSRPVILSLSNNYFGIPLGQPRPDAYGISVYKRVWDQTVTKRYFEYPFPAHYYTWRSAWMELLTGKPSMLHELQAEPWGPQPIREMPISEQDKSMSAEVLRDRIHYAVDMGYRQIDFWGAEWWYWRKEKLNDPSLWNTVKQEIRKY